MALPAVRHQHRARTAGVLEARHRCHARVEDYIRCGKATGLDHLPSTSLKINQAWCVAATIAADLLSWLRLLCLTEPLAQALHTAVRLVRGQRRRKIKIPETWPWASELEAAFHAAFALPVPT
ncbi:MAG: transposase [Pseudonocardiaceae bacterium]